MVTPPLLNGTPSRGAAGGGGDEWEEDRRGWGPQMDQRDLLKDSPLLIIDYNLLGSAVLLYGAAFGKRSLVLWVVDSKALARRMLPEGLAPYVHSCQASLC